MKKSVLPAFVLAAALLSLSFFSASKELHPTFTKAPAITMAELARTKAQGVSVVEVSDYVFGKYQGGFLPSPPHADLNPRKAYVIFWKDFPFRFVFWHEASYCPFFELPSGAGQCYQFWEGNDGPKNKAELFNQWGRQEKNSFVDILDPGPRRVWVRWTYFGSKVLTGERSYRAVEDFWAFPNGLILRRQSFVSLIPHQHQAYAREPIETIAMCPAGKLWFDVLERDATTGESHALAVLDAFSEKRYDVYWKHKPGTVWGSTARRTGCPWKDLDDSPGVAIVIPMADAAPFCVFGDASGFNHEYTALKEHTFVAETWGSISWDHWPVGWANTQWHEVDQDSWKRYPSHFSPFGMDFFALPNEEVEKGVYYSLIGVGHGDLEGIRRVARGWLEKGESGIPSPDSAADLPSPFGTQSDTPR